MSDAPKDIADIAERLAARAISMNLSPIDAVEWVAQQAIMGERAKYRPALESIAAYDDTAASEHLKRTGSFSAFDEPGSVAIAREALERKP